MSQSSLGTLLQSLDDWRVRQHFKRVEIILRDRDVSHLTPDVQQQRKQRLEQLHKYVTHGGFPRNHEIPGYSPCFMDHDGRECAVAHLMMASGHTELANDIAAAANYAYVQQMSFPELDDWAAQAGLSHDELALIQPGYFFTFDGPLLSMAIAAWTVGISALVINAVYFVRRRIGIFMPATGIIVATILLLLTAFFLYASVEAYTVGVNSDASNRDLAMLAVEPLNFGALISLCIAVLTGSISVYRMWGFFRSRSHEQVL